MYAINMLWGGGGRGGGGEFLILHDSAPCRQLKGHISELEDANRSLISFLNEYITTSEFVTRMHQAVDLALDDGFRAPCGPL